MNRAAAAIPNRPVQTSCLVSRQERIGCGTGVGIKLEKSWRTAVGKKDAFNELNYNSLESCCS